MLFVGQAKQGIYNGSVEAMLSLAQDIGHKCSMLCAYSSICSRASPVEHAFGMLCPRTQDKKCRTRRPGTTMHIMVPETYTQLAGQRC